MLVANKDIWYETFPELVARWYNRQPEALRERLVSSANASLRAEARAEVVLKACGLLRRTPLKTAREWETRWVAADVWRGLSLGCAKFGWRAARHRGDGSKFELVRDALEASEEETVMIADCDLAGRVEEAVRSGLLLPLTIDDFAVLALAGEFYGIVSRKLGSVPQPWVEELA